MKRRITKKISSSAQSNYSSKNLLATQPALSTLNEKALTPRIACKMGIHMDLITGHGNSEDGSKLIEIVKNKKKYPDENIIETLTEHFQDVKKIIEDQNDKRYKSLVMYVNLRDLTGATALHYACQLRFETSTDIAKLLLERGAHIGVAASKLGLTPLHLAILNKNVLLTLYLLKNGAPIDTKTLSFDAEDDIERILMDERRGNVFNVGLVTNRGKASKYIVLCDGDYLLTLRDVIYFEEKPTKQMEGLDVLQSPERS